MTRCSMSLGEQCVKLMESGVIEVAPLAFMRGRTLARAFVILDEAQNCSSAQMKMFLTRLGEDSRMVVTGDPSQSDLPGGRAEGLNQALDILADVEGVAVCAFHRKGCRAPSAGEPHRAGLCERSVREALCGPRSTMSRSAVAIVIEHAAWRGAGSCRNCATARATPCGRARQAGCSRCVRGAA